jgi:hypothetical protein
MASSLEFCPLCGTTLLTSSQAFCGACGGDLAPESVLGCTRAPGPWSAAATSSACTCILGTGH